MRALAGLASSWKSGRELGEKIEHAVTMSRFRGALDYVDSRKVVSGFVTYSTRRQLIILDLPHPGTRILLFSDQGLKDNRLLLFIGGHCSEDGTQGNLRRPRIRETIRGTSTAGGTEEVSAYRALLYAGRTPPSYQSRRHFKALSLGSNSQFTTLP